MSQSCIGCNPDTYISEWKVCYYNIAYGNIATRLYVCTSVRIDIFNILARHDVDEFLKGNEEKRTGQTETGGRKVP